VKNIHPLRYAHPSSLQRTGKHASFLRISRAVHPAVFDQPGENCFFNNLPGGRSAAKKTVDRKLGFMLDIRIRLTEQEGGTGNGED